MLWLFDVFKALNAVVQVFFHSWGIKTQKILEERHRHLTGRQTQKIKNIFWCVCDFTFSSPLPTTCVVASVCDTSLRCPLWSTVAVLPGVTMATPPLHFCHHLVSYFISWSPVRPIAEDEKGVCETTSRFSCAFTRHDPVTLSSRLFLVSVGRLYSVAQKAVLFSMAKFSFILLSFFFWYHCMECRKHDLTVSRHTCISLIACRLIHVCLSFVFGFKVQPCLSTGSEH